jgi:hypothetical protein
MFQVKPFVSVEQFTDKSPKRTAPAALRSPWQKLDGTDQRIMNSNWRFTDRGL